MNKTPNKLHTVTIESFSHDGRGIAHINGKITFISNALANETLTCKITKQHKRHNEAEAVEVITEAPERTPALCAHYNICGGCSLQHMHMNTQIQIKQKTLLEMLKHFGKVIPEVVLPPLSGNEVYYRRKARLGVLHFKKNNQTIIGFRQKSSNHLTNVHTCTILDKRVGTKIFALQNLINQLEKREHIPQIEVAIGDTETALVFRHLTSLPQQDLDKLCEFAREHEMHFYLQPNAPEKIHKIWPLDSDDKLTYQINVENLLLKMQFHPLDFIQVNAEINQRLITQALQLLNPQATDSILDLFCGLGNFTLPLALKAKQVTGIEGSSEMTNRAQQNALLNNLTNTEFFPANLMDTTLTSAWLNRQYDKILLDPPRTGAKEIIAQFHKFKAKAVCYVSCNPATLARDVKELVYTHKYTLKQVGVINMFPHTDHIEAIALFEK